MLYGDLIQHSVTTIDMGLPPLMSEPRSSLVTKRAEDVVNSRGKRLLDLALAVVLLLAFMPVMILVAIMIKLDSKGSVLFRQERYGLNKKIFHVYKFRTMTAAEGRGTFTQAKKCDPRVTRVGSFLRRTSLDELPQLLNIIRGEMSFVGPRPHPTVMDDYYATHMPLYRERHLVRIGFRALLVVHVVAVLAGLDELSPEIRETVTRVQPWTLAAAALTIPLGLAGFAMAWRRTGRLPGVRTVVPWGSMYVWYAMLPIVPESFVWLQLAHALQYLEFPLRVELNRRERRTKPRHETTLPRAGYVGLYYVGLVAAGLLVFASPFLLDRGADGVALAALIAAAVNVHHYFVDGCIWKISNPAVRGELFAHVAKPGAA